MRLGPERVREDFTSSIIQAAELSGEESPEAERSPWDPALQDMAELRSGSEASVRRALARIEDPHPLLIHPLIDLFGDDRYAFFAMAHLRERRRVWGNWWTRCSIRISHSRCGREFR